MKGKTMQLHLARATIASLLLTLSACGGGSDTSTPAPAPAPTPSPSPAPAPAPTPAPAPAADRIEPFDPALATKSTAAPAAALPLPSATVSATITLPPLAVAKSAATATPGTPLQIGQGRSLSETATTAQTAALLHWQPGNDGSQTAALRFIATNAQGVRLGIRIESLPPGARLQFYNPQGQIHVIDAGQLNTLVQRNLDAGADTAAAQMYWSPEVTGGQVTLVIEIPAQADPDSVRLSVPQLSHITITPAQEQEQQLAKAGSGSCEIDVACDADYIEQGRSVARLRFVESDGNAYQCTGTLMNDMASSSTPYLLTAHHCISDQVAASSLTTDWLLRAAACGASTVAPQHSQLTGGSTLLYTNTDADTTLVRLNNPAPAGVVFAGSYFGTDAQPGTSISDVHQPEGDLQKISLGQISSFSLCSPTNSTCVAASSSRGTYFSVQWQQGVVEPGSSGSGAFITLGQHRYLIGQLFGGTSSCTNPTGQDYFSRFDLNYTNALHQWLNP